MAAARRRPGHTRFNPDEDRLTPANVASLSPSWSVEVPEGLSESIVSGNRVYVTYGKSPDGEPGWAGVRAFDLGTGTTTWDTSIETGLGAGAGDVGFSEDELWLSAPNDDQSDNVMWRLDPTTGDVVASESTGYGVTPMVTDEGRVAYVHTSLAQPDRGSLVVRDRTSLSTLWSYDFPGSRLVPRPDGWFSVSDSAPTMADGRIYVAYSSTLYAFDAGGCGASTCGPLWTRRLSGWHQAPIAGGDGRVLVTSRIMEGEADATILTGHVTAVDGADGSPLWDVPFAGPDMNDGAVIDTAVAGDTVYVSWYRNTPEDQEALLTAYAVEGCGGAPCPRWSTSAPLGPLAVAGGVVYLGTSGEVRAYAAEGCGGTTCAPPVSVTVPGGPMHMSVAHGNLVVRSTAPAGSSVPTAFVPG